MSETTQANQSDTQNTHEIDKRYVYLAFALLVICAISVTIFVCRQIYTSTKRDYLQEESVALSKDANDAVAAITAWSDDLQAQAGRVSSSELYRLFAKDANELGDQRAAQLNDPNAKISDSDTSLATLAEQVPLMRNVLLDFMNYTGFSDARIINGEGLNLLSALSRPTPVTPMQVEVVRRALQTGKFILSPIRNTGSALMVDFADPLPALLSGEGNENPVAALLLTSVASGPLGHFLASSNRIRPKASLYIVQRNGTQWELVLPHEVTPLSPTLQTFFNEQKDSSVPFGRRAGLYDGKLMYSLGVKVPGLDWWLMADMPAPLVDNALQERSVSISVMGGLACLGFILFLPLVWWLAVGRGEHARALQFRDMYHTIQQQKQMLDSVNVSLEVGLFMADMQGEVQVCNKAFADIVQCEDIEEITGKKTLFMLFPGNGGEKLLGGVNAVIRDGHSTVVEVEHVLPQGTRLYRTTLFPFVEPVHDNINGVVGTIQDITEFRHRAQQQQRRQVQTMSAFLRAIESIDPYLSGHSRTMRALGELVARQMKLSDRDMNTITTAAELSQVGKLSLPQELLRKEGKLTPEELLKLRGVPQAAYNILNDIEFELPVADAVYAMNESMDGKGYPRGLRGDAISIHARVLAVLNAFCAMTSPRFYRDGMDPAAALDILRKNKGMDQHVVQALQDVLGTIQGMEVLHQHHHGDK